MNINNQYFDVKVFNFDDNISIHIIDIKEFTPQLISLLDNRLVSICEGDSDSNLQQVKNRILDYLDGKNQNILMGSIAEFILHLYLGTLGFKQECLFFNLEEKSIKKGFDGYYSKCNDEWIMESKSGTINTKTISHPNKIKEAYTDLEHKLAGNCSNNPWQNAYNHASHVDVATNRSIRNHIKSMTDDFQHHIFHSIKDFNIIPGSTIFLNASWLNNPPDLETKLHTTVKDLDYNDIMVICITKISLQLFVDYLNDNSEEAL